MPRSMSHGIGGRVGIPHYLRLGLSLLGLVTVHATARGQEHPGLVRLGAGSLSELGAWSSRISGMVDAGELKTRQVREDTLIPGRQHERLAQFYKDVPVFGGELVRQWNGRETVSVFATLYVGIQLDVTPSLSVERAKALVESRTGAALGPSRDPELMVLPKDDGSYVLAYRVRVMTPGDLTVYFIDARTGEIAFEYSDLKTQGMVGAATGVLGDQKKISTNTSGSTFVTDDQLRPPSLRTFDMRGNLSRTIDILNGVRQPTTADLANDADNVWTDGASVDAHVYEGLVYDFYFKRFSRLGLDNNNIPIIGLVHPVNRADVFSYSSGVISTFYLNAFYCCDGMMMYGEGLASNLTVAGQRWNYLAGALDVVAHELTHGVTDFSSQLIYRNESGALNEAFSDIMGTSVEFTYQSPGAGSMNADYLLGEDVVTPGGLRSMANPTAYGDPDHYSRRYVGSADNGGVHINSGIVNQAFYLAIEGGRNATSGQTVQGVGSANRNRIESIFYRAFVFLLPPGANFSTARAASIQAARDLYGVGSAAETAVTQAWSAVGVN